MISDKRVSRIGTVAISSVTVVALMAAALTGLIGWLPAQADAAPVPEQVTLLGSDDLTVVALGDPTSAEMKFDTALALGTASSATSLASPAERRRASIIRTPGKPTVKKAQQPKKAKKHKKKRIRAKTGWRRSNVSWYGPGLYGNGMAGGGKLRRDSMVVAHRSMKFGTKIQFRYKGRTAIAVVRDRGPFIGGRTFDLGPGTAKSLRFKGVGKVKWRIIR